MTNTKQRGGARPGSGRPSTDRKVPVMVRITPEAAEILDRQRNRSEYIDDLIKKSRSANNT